MFYQNPYGPAGNVVGNPMLPYNGNIPGGLSVGKRIQVTGFVRPAADSFRFDLRTNFGAIALHINPRFHAGCIVRNTERGGWQHEERNGPMVFQKGSAFDLSITCEPSQFNVVINGQHAFNYVHRLPYQEVTQFGIEGELDIHRIVYHGDSGGDAVRSPAVPISIPIRDLRPGKLIQIRGSVPPSAGRFQVDLQLGGGIMPNDIGLHFNVRFNDPYSPQPIVVRTNRSGGAWGQEERDQTFCPFQRGAPFEMLLLLEADQWKVAVNGQHFISFRHRGPWQNCNHVGIVGDVQIDSVSQFN